MLNVEAARTPDFLHLLSLLALGLVLLDTHLLKEDICAIKHRARVTGIRALLASERLHLRAADSLGSSVGVELFEQVTAELCLGNTRLLQICCDLTANVIAGVIYRD